MRADTLILIYSVLKISFIYIFKSLIEFILVAKTIEYIYKEDVVWCLILVLCLISTSYVMFKYLKSFLVEFPDLARRSDFKIVKWILLTTFILTYLVFVFLAFNEFEFQFQFSLISFLPLIISLYLGFFLNRFMIYVIALL